MYPDDRVLVGVINRKRDLKTLLDEQWYRIPQNKLKRGIHAEYLGFFLSGRVFKEKSGGIHYYARIKGLELQYRRDLLPKEADHPRAEDVYYKVLLDVPREKEPTVLNPTKRTVSFIHSTWDRFIQATEIADLYSKSDYFVDRIYHALRSKGIRSERIWSAESKDYDFAPAIQILCEDGLFTASAVADHQDFVLDPDAQEDKILAEILRKIENHGGPVFANIPRE